MAKYSNMSVEKSLKNNKDALIFTIEKAIQDDKEFVNRVHKAYPFNNKVLFDNLDGVDLRLRARMLSSTGKDKTLADILEIFYNKEHLKMVTEEIEQSYGEGVCFILDGLDEYHSPGSIITKIINKDSYLYKAMVIVASRPIGTAELRHSNFASKRIEVLGFSKDRIINYIHKYKFDSGSAAKLQAYLQSHINVFHMCYLPVHIAMICYIYDKTEEIPNTETKIYEMFTLLTIKRKLEREHIKNTPLSLGDLDGTLKKRFADIRKLAFEMTIDTKQTISQGRTNIRLSDGSGCDVHSLGLVTVDATAKLLQFEDLYSFLHLTFQEYLAAHHIATQDEDKQTRIIEQYKDKNIMLMVWKFYFGMTTFTDKKNRHLNMIMNSQSMNDTHRVQCAFESQQQTVCACLFHDGNLTFKDYVFTPIDYYAIDFVVSNAKSKILLTLDNCVMDKTGILFYPTSLNGITSISFKNKNLKQFASFHCLLQKLPSIECLKFGQLKHSEIAALTETSLHLTNLRVLSIEMPLGDVWDSSESERLLTKLTFNSNNLQLVQYSYCYSDYESHHDSLSHLLRSFKCEIQPLTDIPEDFLCNRDVDFSRVTRFLCLTSLKLINCNMKDSDVHYLVDSRTRYESLRLDVNRITDNGAVVLADVVRKCTGLKCLSLSCNQIGDEGAMALAAALHTNTSLMELDLQCNAIGDEGAVAIAEAVTAFPSGLQLLLCNVNVTSEGAKHVLQCRPTAMIWKDTPEIAWNILNMINKTAIEQAIKCLTYMRTLKLQTDGLTSPTITALVKNLSIFTNLKVLIINMLSDIENEIEELLKKLTFNRSHLQLLQYNYCNATYVELHRKRLLQMMRLFRCEIEPLCDIPEDILSNLDVDFSRVTRFLCLTSLKITNSNMKDSDVHYLVHSGTRYESLRLDVNRITDNGAVVLADVVRKCTGLKCLSLSCNHIGDEGAMALAAALHTNTSLMELDLQSSLQVLNLSENNIGPNGAAAIARWMRCGHEYFPQDILTCLSKKTKSFLFNDFKNAPEIKHRCTCNLQSLNLDDNHIGVNGAAALACGIRYSKLQMLDLSNNEILPDGERALATGIKHCQTLHTVILDKNKICAPLKGCTSLQRLSLRSNICILAPSIINELNCCSQLQSLDLGLSEIGPHGADALARNIKHWKHLKELNIESNNIGSRAIVIAIELQHCGQLHTVNIKNNNLKLLISLNALKDIPAWKYWNLVVTTSMKQQQKP